MEMKKVLIVDDAEFIRETVVRLLNNYGGFEPLCAASAEVALPLYEAKKPWLVLMDIMMPGGMNGIECTAKIRALDPNAQIVMLSARSDEKNREAAQQAGACGFIAKPFKAEDLIAVITNRQ